jgi:hypothetical protein
MKLLESGSIDFFWLSKEILEPHKEALEPYHSTRLFHIFFWAEYDVGRAPLTQGLEPLFVQVNAFFIVF